MKKQDFITAYGIDTTEDTVSTWDELSYDNKRLAVSIMRENGINNAEEAIEDNDCYPDQFHFPFGYLILSYEDKDNLQSFFDGADD